MGVGTSDDACVPGRVGETLVGVGDKNGVGFGVGMIEGVGVRLRSGVSGSTNLPAQHGVGVGAGRDGVDFGVTTEGSEVGSGVGTAARAC